MNTTSFLIMRVAVGISFFGHGLVRLPKSKTFSAGMAHNFKKSMIPGYMIVPFSYALPTVEFTIGTLLITGLFAKVGLIGGSLEMMALIFGSCMIEMWEIIPSQLIHVAFCALLLQFIGNNTW
jgi:thiosulfate dehydrogenase [quinone] large subunit